MYKDWRRTADQRARDLASKMTIEQIAGLMLYSLHQSIPAGSNGPFIETYNEKSFQESGAKASDLSDQQIKFLTEGNIYDFGFGMNWKGVIDDERTAKYNKTME